MLAGRILKARLYGRALRADEVAASAGENPSYVSERDLLAKLSEEHRAEKNSLEGELKALEKRRAELAGAGEARQPGDFWRDLAQSMFNLKEFIYIR